MYLVYSLLTLVALRRRLAVFRLPGDPLQEVHRQPAASGSATCRSRSTSTASESIWIHAVSVGEALTARALVADLKARYPRLRLFLSTTTMAGQQVARRNLQQRRRGLLFPVRLGLHRPPHAQHREAAPVRDDGDRDLAEPAAALPRARRQDGRDQRPHLVAVVSALPADPARSSGACSPTSIASACRARNRRAG